jgi:hypothetical protein
MFDNLWKDGFDLRLVPVALEPQSPIASMTGVILPVDGGYLVS